MISTEKVNLSMVDILNLNIIIPDIQREIDENHVENIIKFMEDYYDTYNNYIFINVLTITKFHMNEMIKYSLIDGQHRYVAYKKLYEKYEDRDMNIDLEIITVSNESQIDKLFKIINSSKPSTIYSTSIDTYKIIHAVCNLFKKDYHQYIKMHLLRLLVHYS